MGDRSEFSNNINIRKRQKAQMPSSESRLGNNLWIHTSNDQSLTSLKVSGLLSPLCSLLPTDKTKIPAGDINHSMTHLTHRPFSSAGHPIIRLNAVGSYEASESNG